MSSATVKAPDGETAPTVRAQRQEVRVVPELCQIAQDRSKAVIVLEAYSPHGPAAATENLQSMDATNMAIGHAASVLGMANPRLDVRNVSPYFVNDAGESVAAIVHQAMQNGTPLSPQDPRGIPTTARCDIHLTARPI